MTETIEKTEVVCEYCWKPIEGEPVNQRVWINGVSREMTFCSKNHAAYCQMSAEG